MLKKKEQERFLGVIEYDGAGFSGFQIQKYKRTVEDELKKALIKLSLDPEFSYSSRLDSGVHAKELVFDFNAGRSWQSEKLRLVLNRLLPADIRIKKITRAPKGFVSRYSVVRKKYIYTIALTEKPSPFTARYVWWAGLDLDASKMRKAAKLLLGIRDFSQFIAAGSDRKTTAGRLESIKIKKAGNLLWMEFSAKSFYYKMVRNLAGFLYDVGRGRFSIDEAEKIIRRKEAFSKFTLPASGLTLEKVKI